MRAIFISIKTRWQLILVSILNLPMLISLIFVLYVSLIQVYASEVLGSSWDLVLYALLFAAFMPYILAFSIISIPFLFWYLWKLGRIVQSPEVTQEA